MKRVSLLSALVLLLGLTSVSFAATGKLSIQGHLANGGTPMEGEHAAVFSFFDAPNDGNQLWTETDTIHVASFLFSATLGKNVPIPDTVFTSPGAWLETTIDGTTLSPRIAYYPQPQITIAQPDNPWRTDGTNVWRESGNVGVGTSRPAQRLTLSDSPTTGSFMTFLQHGSASDRRTGIGLTTYDLADEQNSPSHSWHLEASNNFPGLAKGLYINEYADPDGNGNPCDGQPGNLCFAQRLYIQDGTGRVGIGTTSPTSLLHVYSPVHAVASILVEDGGGAIGGSLHLKHGGTDIPALHNLGALDFLANVGGTEKILARVTASSVAASTQQSRLYFSTANGDAPLERMRIDEIGNVGIGTTTPTASLDVAGSVRSSTGGFVFPDGSTQATAAGASLWASSGNDAYNTNAGIVFIGGTSTGDPSAKLQVVASSPQILLRDANAGVSQTIGVDGNGLSINYDLGHGLTVSRMSGNVSIAGSLTVAGTKCRGVEGTTYGTLYYNAVESGHALFSNDGGGQLVNGTCHIEMDPKWLAGVTVNEQHPLRVSVTFTSENDGGYHVKKGATGFDVIGPAGSNATFDWEVKARQKGYEDLFLNAPSSIAKQ